MDHQSFEEWLLGGMELTPDQADACREHLAACVRCRELEQAWRSVEAQLGSVSQAAPDAGFTLRWTSRLEAHRLAQGRKRARLAFLAAVLAMILIGLTRAPDAVSLSEAAASTLGSLVKVGNLFYILRNVLTVFASVLSEGWTGGLWAAVTAAACALVGAWFFSLYYFTSRGVRKGVRP